MTIQELLQENADLRSALLTLRELIDDTLDDLDPEDDMQQEAED
jgi:hypothetical protein